MPRTEITRLAADGRHPSRPRLGGLVHRSEELIRSVVLRAAQLTEITLGFRSPSYRAVVRTSTKPASVSGAKKTASLASGATQRRSGN